ncbi:MAG: acetoacetate--CoA ligase [Proteobacteria bacterium]|nr:acetoacetate--CoA ligase [Pseudomonadota bacterium]
MAEALQKTAPESPLWQPANAVVQNSRLEAFRQEAEKASGKKFAGYEQLWQWSIEKPDAFWNLAWDFMGVIGDKGSVVLENPKQMPGGRFFPNGKINFAENCLRRRDNADAIVFRGEDKVERRLTWAQLYDRVSQLRQVLQGMGVKKGDRVAGFVSHMPEAVIGLLATSSLGAIWSSASPDFGVQGVVDRFGQIEPKVLIAVDGYYYNGKVIDCLPKIAEIQPLIKGLENTLIVSYLSNDPDCSKLANARGLNAACDAVKPQEIKFDRYDFNTPLVIMYSSGTTGVPKCIVHGAGGTLLQHMKEHQLQCDIKRDDRVFYFTTCGWMMWNWQVTALASEATLLTYDGSPFYPDGNVLWNYADEERMTLFGTAAKYIDAIKKGGLKPKQTHKLKELRTLTSTGSPLVHESFDYIYDAIKSDLHLASISGGTDIISCFVIGNNLSPVWRGEIQGAGLGYAMDAFDDDGKPIAPGAGQGELVCTVPFPSMPVGFWNDEGNKKYKAAYFERFDNVWCHGDWVERTVHGGWIIHGRSDATLKPGGVRIGTAEIYRQVEQVQEVLESIAIGQMWEGDQRIILFVRLREGVALTEDLQKKIKDVIKRGASPRHVPAKILAVADIPRTKSGKITELAVRDIIHGRPVKNVEALANPAALDLYKDLTELKS